MTGHAHLNYEALLGSLSEYIDGGLSPELCQERRGKRHDEAISYGISERE